MSTIDAVCYVVATLSTSTHQCLRTSAWFWLNASEILHVLQLDVSGAPSVGAIWTRTGS